MILRFLSKEGPFFIESLKNLFRVQLIQIFAGAGHRKLDHAILHAQPDAYPAVFFAVVLDGIGEEVVGHLADQGMISGDLDVGEDGGGDLDRPGDDLGILRRIPGELTDINGLFVQGQLACIRTREQQEFVGDAFQALDLLQ